MESKHIALTVLFLIVAFGVLIILSITLAVKRHVYRRRLRLKSPYTAIGVGSNKNVRSDISKYLADTQKIRCEPRLLQQYYRDNFETYAHDDETSFIYRMKAVDEFRLLEDSLGQADPRGRMRTESCSSGWDRLRVYRGKRRALEAADAGLVKEYVELYTRARHEPGCFGLVEYTRFVELQRQLVDVVVAYSQRSGSRSRPTSQPLSPTDLLVDLGVSSSTGGGGGGGDSIEMSALSNLVCRRPSLDSSCSSSDDSQTALIDFQPAMLGASSGGAGATGGTGVGSSSGGVGSGGAGGSNSGAQGGTSSGSSIGPSVRYVPVRRREEKKGGLSNEAAQC